MLEIQDSSYQTIISADLWLFSNSLRNQVHYTFKPELECEKALPN